MAVPYVVSARVLPAGVVPTDVARELCNGRLGVSAEGGMVFVVPGSTPHQEKVTSFDPEELPPLPFLRGVRILGVFGRGQNLRVKLWGRPSRDVRIGIWMWTWQNGLRFREPLESFDSIRRGAHEGAVVIGRRETDPVGSARFLIPGHSVTLPTHIVPKMMANGGMAWVDYDRRVVWYASPEEPERPERIWLPRVNGLVHQYLRWGHHDLFVLQQAGGRMSLWYGGRPLELGPTGYQLEGVWGDPEGERLALLFRLSRSGTIPFRQFVVTDGGHDRRVLSTSTLLGGEFRLGGRSSEAVAWSRRGGHLAVHIERVRREAGSPFSHYLPSIVMADAEIPLPSGTTLAHAVLRNTGELAGVIAHREPASKVSFLPPHSTVVMVPTFDPVRVADAFGLRFDPEGRLVWTAVLGGASRTELVHMSDAPRPGGLMHNEAVA